MNKDFVFYLTNITENQVILNKEEAKHCFQVLRKKIGDSICFTDGLGFQYEGTISSGSKNEGIVQITAKEQIEKMPYQLHIAIAPTKNISRYEWFLEKACEIGVSSITPLLCEHSERKNIRLDRLNRILISAMKQSQQVYLPKLNELTSFTEFVKTQEAASKFIAICEPEQTQILKNCVLTNDILLLIGPEGDFDSKEATMAKETGYKAISLGNTRLRTETAGVQACSWISLIKTAN